MIENDPYATLPFNPYPFFLPPPFFPPFQTNKSYLKLFLTYSWASYRSRWCSLRFLPPPRNPATSHSAVRTPRRSTPHLRLLSPHLLDIRRHLEVVSVRRRVLRRLPHDHDTHNEQEVIHAPDSIVDATLNLSPSPYNH